MRESYKQLCVNKLDNLGEVDKFPERHKWSKLIQDKIDNLNRLKIRDWIRNQKNSPQRKA